MKTILALAVLLVSVAVGVAGEDPMPTVPKECFRTVGKVQLVDRKVEPAPKPVEKKPQAKPVEEKPASAMPVIVNTVHSPPHLPFYSPPVIYPAAPPQPIFQYSPPPIQYSPNSYYFVPPAPVSRGRAGCSS